MNNQRIKLTENVLNGIIKRSVSKILRENDLNIFWLTSKFQQMGLVDVTGKFTGYQPSLNDMGRWLDTPTFQRIKKGRTMLIWVIEVGGKQFLCPRGMKDTYDNVDLSMDECDKYIQMAQEFVPSECIEANIWSIERDNDLCFMDVMMNYEDGFWND